MADNTVAEVEKVVEETTAAVEAVAEEAPQAGKSFTSSFNDTLHVLNRK